jgi:DNA-binding MarR family transcriptional regulator
LFEGARSMKELSVELGVSQSAITQIADRLEAAGLVTRGAVGDDRRVKNLELTPRARKLLREREEQRIDRVREILEQLSPPDREVLLESLDRFGAAAQALDGAND